MGKKDPAWKYGVEVKEGTYLKIKCSFCNLIVPSGISRFKNHLAGSHKSVQECTAVPAEVKAEIAKALKRGESKKVETQMRLTETIELGSHVERLYANAGMGSSHGSVSDRGVRGPLNNYFTSPSLTSEGTPSGPPISVADLAVATRQEIARYFYENGIPFHTACSPSFISMIWAVGSFGIGLTCPTPYEIGGPMLEVEKKVVGLTIAEVKLSWENTGVTITSDGWKDIRGTQLINFLVNSPAGTVFLRTVDASDVVKTGQCLFEMLDAIVEEVGERLVMQVVTDNASNYVSARKKLMEKRPGLYWTPCAAHCIDLMLETIGDLPQHKTALRKAKKVTKYIYNHGFVLAMMKAQVKKDLVRLAANKLLMDGRIYEEDN